MNKRNILIYTFTLLFSFTMQAGNSKDASFVMNSSNFVFPYKKANYVRTNIYPYNEKGTDVAVSYLYKNEGIKASVLIHIYQAKKDILDQLLKEYDSSLFLIVDMRDSSAIYTQEEVPFIHNGYEIKGLRAASKSNVYYKTVSVYECGPWFFSLRITSKDLDAAGLAALETDILNTFAPAYLVESNPLNIDASCNTGFYFADLIGGIRSAKYRRIQRVLQK